MHNDWFGSHSQSCAFSFLTRKIILVGEENCCCSGLVFGHCGCVTKFNYHNFLTRNRRMVVWLSTFLSKKLNQEGFLEFDWNWFVMFPCIDLYPIRREDNAGRVCIHPHSHGSLFSLIQDEDYNP